MALPQGQAEGQAEPARQDRHALADTAGDQELRTFDKGAEQQPANGCAHESGRPLPTRGLPAEQDAQRQGQRNLDREL